MSWFDRTVAEVIGSDKNYSNVVGVEIELELEEEASELPTKLSKVWQATRDGSLRRNGIEYVLSKPSTAKVAGKAVVALLEHVKKGNTIIDEGRAGVHVHINVLDMPIRKLFCFITLCHIFDDALCGYCGRKDNHFCVPWSLSAAPARLVKESIERHSLARLHTDEIRYASMNLKAICEHGSIEFRSLPSNGEYNKIFKLIDILLHLKDVAMETISPMQLVSDASSHGFVQYAIEVLGEYFIDLQPYIDDNGYNVVSCIRDAQWYAYSTDWR